MTIHGLFRSVRTQVRLVSASLAKERAASNRPRRLPRRRNARGSLFCFVVAFLGLNVLAGIAVSDVRVRDPEFGRRSSALRQRIAENPGRPLVLVVGSSRAAMGVRPSEWEAVRPANPSQPDPLIFNMSLLGSGPIMELMSLRRVYAQGFRPSVVLLEYWPPFLHQDDGHYEPHRITRDRLMDGDRELIREYFQNPAQLEEEMDWRRRNPLFGYREPMLAHVLSSWLLDRKRLNWTWDNVDDWGWKPGPALEPGPSAARTALHKRSEELYKPLFAAHRISPISDQAYRASVALAREHGAMVGLVFLPESSEFRQLYPASVERAAAEHLARMSRELDLPVINGREWLDDGFVADGFHLCPKGAAEFTRKFGSAVSVTFPQVQP